MKQCGDESSLRVVIFSFENCYAASLWLSA